MVEKTNPVEEKQKIGVDQSMYNLPLDPGQQDMLELLEKKMKQLHLSSEQKDILRDGLKSEQFSDKAKQVAQELRERGKNDIASKLMDISPLFDPHDFWQNQPVPHANEKVGQELWDKPIEVKTLQDVPQEPYSLPTGYSWSNIDLKNESHAQELYELLTNNYVEDDDAMFRFDYSVPFLRWALMPPEQPPEWLIGVRAGKKQRLFGFIAGIPVHVNLNGKKVKMAEINFLCVHRDLRAKRLAPVLIKEITRRVNLHDVWQAIYTAGVTIPTPVTNATYWHRILNPNKCLDVRFSGLPAKTTRARYLKLQKLPDKIKTPGLRPMIKKDVPIVHELLSKHLCQNKIHMTFTQQEVEYYFLPREGVINSYVIEDAHTITDFYSFYSLPSKILKHETEKILYVAYSYYNISTTNRLKDGMEDMLILARDLKYDVFNALDLMENTKFLETLKFGPGDGTLHYYLYNWRVGGDQEVMPQEVAVVLV